MALVVDLPVQPGAPRRSQAVLTWPDFIAAVMLISFLVFPRAYAEFKFVLIAVFGLTFLPRLLGRSGHALDNLVFIFYGTIGICGLGAALAGSLNGGDIDGIIDGLRLYVAWSLAFTIIVQAILTTNAFRIWYNALLISGAAIVIINFIALYGQSFGLYIFSDSFIKEMDLNIGFHDGYVQIVSQNIGSLFFIVPFLIASAIRIDGLGRGLFFYIVLFSCIALTIFSGRRALWVVVALSPALCFLLSYINSTSHLNRYQRSITIIYVIALLSLIAYLFSFEGAATLDFLLSAFSNTDERWIQMTYLIDGFMQYPFFGSGFGISTPYIRNLERPWIYELSYFQVLFNFGLFGSVIFMFLGLKYFRIGLQFSKYRNQESLGSFPLLIGLTGLLIGTYSNPYLGSFDFLSLLAVLPLIASVARRQSIV